MGDVDAVVDAEADGDDDDDAADGVDGDAPEVHEAANVNHGHDDHLPSNFHNFFFFVTADGKALSWIVCPVNCTIKVR